MQKEDICGSVHCIYLQDSQCSWRQSASSKMKQPRSKEICVFLHVCVCVYLIYCWERWAGGREGVVDKEEERFLGSQRHTLAYQETQLPHCKQEEDEGVRVARRIKCSDLFWIMLDRVQLIPFLAWKAMFSPVKSEGTRYFFLSRSGARDLAARSTMICKETNKKNSCLQSTEEVQYNRTENKWNLSQL